VIQSKCFSLVLATVLAGSACQKVANTASTSNATGNSTTVNSNADAAPANTTTSSDAGNVSGSPTEVYKAAYAARKNKDIATLKKIMSKDILKFLGDMGKDDKKSLDDMLNELCARPQAATADARNEKVDGDHASIEYLDEDGKWQTMDFAKEDGVWKMSVGKGDDKDPDDAKDDKDNK
jgi:hypothetical protein